MFNCPLLVVLLYAAELSVPVVFSVVPVIPMGAYAVIALKLEVELLTKLPVWTNDFLK